MKLRTTRISIPHDQIWLAGELCHAPNVRGLALILRPAGTPLEHARDQSVATRLHAAGFATLLLNLLTSHEQERDPDAHYNVPQLAHRAETTREWIAHQPPLAGLAVGVIASGTACGAAVRAAARTPDRFDALVCRAGRPDLAGLGPLNTLKVPIRMVVGSEDPDAAMILQAYEHFRGARDWHTVDGANQTFSTPHALERFATLAAEWLDLKLPPPATIPPPSPVANTPLDPPA